MFLRYLQRPLMIAVLIGLLALVLRGAGMTSVITVDERNWMERSSTFWDELWRQGDLSGTFQSTHPGATVMWLAGAGIFWQEHQLNIGIDNTNIKHFQKKATAPLVLASSLLVGLATYLLIRLFRRGPGATMGLLLAADPYLVGMSQIVHLDAILALLMLIALLALFLFVRQRRRLWITISGIAAGLALATKLLPAMWLLPFFVVFLLVDHYRRASPTPWGLLLRELAQLILLAVVTLLVVWPAPLTKPDFQLGYLARDAKTIVFKEHVSLADSSDPIAPASFYARTVLGRSMPSTLLLAAGAMIMLLYSVVEVVRRRWPAWAGKPRRQYRGKDGYNIEYVAWLLVYVLGFLIVVTLVAKKADRYALPALVVLPVLAGWLAGLGWRVWRERVPSSRMVKRGVLLVLALMILAVPMMWYPYNVAYNNPWAPDVRPLSQQGWGEGLEAAAAWLNALPNPEKLNVASWYPSVMSVFFNGVTMNLSARDDERVTHVVTYRNMGGRAADTLASQVLGEYKDREPVHTVTINGVPYAWIYEAVGTEVR